MKIVIENRALQKFLIKLLLMIACGSIFLNQKANNGHKGKRTQKNLGVTWCPSVVREVSPETQELFNTTTLQGVEGS